LTSPAEFLQLLFDIGAGVVEWITILLSTIGAITTAIVVNPIALAVVALVVTYKASGFGFGLIRKLVKVFK